MRLVHYPPIAAEGKYIQELIVLHRRGGGAWLGEARRGEAAVGATSKVTE